MMGILDFDKQTIVKLIVTLFIGAIGGTIAHYIHLPLAWMIGPMIANICASMAGIQVGISLKLRSFTLVILGCFLGSTFEPEILDNILAWPFSLLSVLVFVVGATILSALYYHKVAKLDFVTSLFSATPGGLTPMTILGSSLGGKEQSISFLQGIRVVFLVCMTPFLVFEVLGYDNSGISQQVIKEEIIWSEVGILLTAAILGVLFAMKMKIPAAQMTGAMFVSAALFLSGEITTDLPSIILETTLWILGSAIGSRFSGFDLKLVKSHIVQGGVNLFCLTAVTLMISAAVAHFFGLEYVAVLLAFAPGGVAEMCLIALALNIDPGFVAFHHLTRISLILLITPIVAKRIQKQKST
ncbi:AbrB family transcriptional regulator [Curvivirga sp.]|uniref:AbrB family transcriptional regulator n=1 Tax=Curvivirga sp. TaxID=2856848 RepID=UPI003B5BCFF9